MTEKYDSTKDTLQHIERVRALITECRGNLLDRLVAHDASKLQDPEKSIFDEFTPKLKGSTYGSDEYKEFLAQMKPALDHHYDKNSHHPENHDRWECPTCLARYDRHSIPDTAHDSDHRWCPVCYPNGDQIFFETALLYIPGVNGMSLLDLIEMLCDWKAAGERHADGSMERSLKVNRQRFEIGDQLQGILENTARELGWLTP